MAWLTPINDDDDETHISPPSPQQSCTSITLSIIMWLMEGNLWPPRKVTMYTHYHQAKWLRKKMVLPISSRHLPTFELHHHPPWRWRQHVPLKGWKKRHVSTTTRKQVNRILKLPLQKLRRDSWRSHKINSQDKLMWRTNRNTCVILNHRWPN
jgi:hypothetical protein